MIFITHQVLKGLQVNGCEYGESCYAYEFGEGDNMSYRSVACRWILPSIIMVLIVFMLAGCKVNEKTWIDQMLAEMEIAWVEADRASLRQEGRDAAVTAVAQKYFRPGMPKAEAFNLLRDMKAQGFHIGEYRHEEARDWPDGEMKPYLYEETKRNLQRRIPPGTSSITARKEEYGRERLIISKGAALTLVLDDKDTNVRNVEARIWANSI
jgi:hypothetical protein